MITCHAIGRLTYDPLSPSSSLDPSPLHSTSTQQGKGKPHSERLWYSRRTRPFLPRGVSSPPRRETTPWWDLLVSCPDHQICQESG
jgi:hypothetical protein